jgi:1-aminocyclopropane-1-carboxylate deaminase/D-cysteine desulfhydrase-like pyridoxal-dependent ACC family enzyme
VDLTRFPLVTLPSQIMRARRLEHALGGGPILIKRDDLAGFGTAGSKGRALEYLVGAARARGRDVLVAGGSPGSNFCAAAAVAASVGGLDCELVIAGRATQEDLPTNVALAVAAGAGVHFTGDERRDALDGAVAARAEKLRAAGRRPFAMPRGGATGLGAVGFAVAARELAGQLPAWTGVLGDRPLSIVLAVGSGASCAGLLAGIDMLHQRWQVVGASVSRPPAEISQRVQRIAEQCAVELGTSPAAAEWELLDERGPGFGVASPSNLADARLALATEGLLLDPTYTMKSFTVLCRRVRDDQQASVLYWHTGGIVTALAAVNQLVSVLGAAT